MLLSDVMSVHILVGNAGVDYPQRLSTLAAVSSQKSDLPAPSTLDGYARAVLYKTVLFILLQCDRAYNPMRSLLSYSQPLLPASAGSVAINLFNYARPLITPKNIFYAKNTQTGMCCGFYGHW